MYLIYNPVSCLVEIKLFQIVSKIKLFHYIVMFKTTYKIYIYSVTQRHFLEPLDGVSFSNLYFLSLCMMGLM